MMLVPINLNNHVYVKLTEHGHKVYNDYFEQFHMAPTPLDYYVDGYAKFQLWNLMQIFGDSCFNGCKLPFETEILYNIESPF